LSVASVVVVLCSAAVAVAQPVPTLAPEAGPVETGHETVERYLAKMGLTEILAEHPATTPEEFARLEALSRDLLRSVPDAGTFDLRINLAKARYLPAEKVAEEDRLRLASVDEVETARVSLGTVAGELRQIAGQLTLRIRQLESTERRGSERIDQVREELAEARNLRALASYYAGWASTYHASLTGRADIARDGLASFAVLLAGDEEDEPTLDRLPRTLLRREPVARAALGTAVCRSIMNQHAEAIAWLDELDRSPDTPESVRGQVFARRLSILAADRRWDTLSVLVERERKSGRFGPVSGEALEPLGVTEARLLAVEVLEAVVGLRQDDPRREAAEPVAAAALTDLVTRGEVGHVLDLLVKYGSLPLGGDGFIVRYVRGLRAYERARSAHAATGEEPDQPLGDAGVRAMYIDAGDLLGQAFNTADATTYPVERGKCGLLLGLSMYYRGALVQAADRLEAVAALAGAAERQEAIWLALVALDSAIERGTDGINARRDAMAAMYLTEYPASDRAATLLLRQRGEGLLDDAAAAEVLLTVSPDSPLYSAARRQAEARLYRVLRRATDDARASRVARYLALVSSVLEADRREVIAVRDTDARRSLAHAAVQRCRRALDASLSGTVPDLTVARRVLGLLAEFREIAGEDSDTLAGEILFRRLQVAAHEGAVQRVNELYLRLEAEGGRSAESAARFLYNRARRAVDDRPDDLDAARELVRAGSAVLAFAVSGGETSGAEAAVVRDRVASAAQRLWSAEVDAESRDLAIRLDTESMRAGVATVEGLTRLGNLAGEVGRDELALEAWRTLSAGAPSGSQVWFKARYRSIEILGRTSPTEAVEALDQHFALYPDGGPSPYGERFDDLRDRLGTRGGRGP
jgi:hypothetical protein